MTKPRDAKIGKPKIRAKEYVCPECNYTEEKLEHEEKLVAYCAYTCPTCQGEGESEAQFKYRTLDGVKTVRFVCSECGANVDITKKMKEKKKKKKK